MILVSVFCYFCSSSTISTEKETKSACCQTEGTVTVITVGNLPGSSKADSVTVISPTAHALSLDRARTLSALVASKDSSTSTRDINVHIHIPGSVKNVQKAATSAAATQVSVVYSGHVTTPTVASSIASTSRHTLRCVLECMV